MMRRGGVSPPNHNLDGYKGEMTSPLHMSNRK